MHTYHTYIFKHIFVLNIYSNTHIFDRQIERKGERERFHLLVHPPNGHHGQSWVKPKLGAQMYIQVSHIGTGIQALGPTSVPSLGKFAEI